MKALLASLVFALVASGCGASFAARGYAGAPVYGAGYPGYGPSPGASYGAPMARGYGFDPRFPAPPPSMYAGRPPFYGAGPYGFMPNMPAYAGTSLDPRFHGAVVEMDRALYGTTRAGTLQPPTPPMTPPASTAGGPYATRADLGVVIDQVLDDHAAVESLHREVEGR